MHGSTAPGGRSDGATAGPAFAVLRQYIKDLSFECPRPIPEQDSPQIAERLSFASGVNVARLDGEHYEVQLIIRGEIWDGARIDLLLELIYAGVFRLSRFPAEQVDPTLHVVAPGLLFPFARNIVVGLCVWSGLQPNVGTIDFRAAYRQRLARQGGDLA